MKKIIFLYLISLMPMLAFAQQATKVLDKVAAAFRNAGGVKVSYTYSAGGETGAGFIKMNGQKFTNDLGDHVFWFNGKTLWSLIKSNEEVNVTNPTSKEIAKMNPYSFVSLYKKGYKASMTGKSSKDDYEVQLTPTNASAAFKSILLRINRLNNQLTYVKMISSDGNMVEITVKSYAKNQKYTNATFEFDEQQYPDVEVVDLR